MSFIILLLLIFSSIFQPGVIWVSLETFRPFFVIALLAVISTVLYSMKNKTSSAWPLEYKLLLGLALMETVSVIQYFWVGEIVNVALNWIKIVIIYFTIVLNVDSYEKIKTVLWVTVLAIATVSIVSYLRYINPDIISIEYRENESADEFANRAYLTYLRAHQLVRFAGYGMYSGANDLALLLTICFPLAYKLFEMDKNLLKRIFLFLLIPFMYFLVLLTVSRGGALGTSLVTMLCILTVRKIKMISNSKMFKIIIVAMIIIGVLTVMVTKLGERNDASSMLGGDQSAGDRLKAWIAGAKMLAKNPFTGVGFDHFPDRVAEYGGPRRIQAHNTIVKVAAESGLIGIFCYLGLLFIAYKKLYFLSKYYSEQGNDDRVLIIQAVFFGLIGFFFNTQFSVKENEWLLYILLGLSTAIYKIYEIESLTVQSSAFHGISRN